MRVEISNVKRDRSGHYYLDLIETEDGRIVAKSTARIWNYTVDSLKETLGIDFDAVIKHGSEILCYCKAEFHPVYGLSFIIAKVDVNFNLGELERKKIATIKKLTDENLIQSNKTKKLAVVIQKIALIGSPNTSGYEDFMKQLEVNSFGFAFDIVAFATKVQGDLAVNEMIYHLQSLPFSNFDTAVLLRGGGSKFDLEPFNDYSLAKAITLCPLPVLTGIGHETDFSVADLVAHSSLKTPSALGAFIVEKAAVFENKINYTYLNIKRAYEQKMIQLNKDLKHTFTDFSSLSLQITQLKRGDLNMLTNRIISLVNDDQANALSDLQLAKQIIDTVARKQVGQSLINLQDKKGLLSLFNQQKFKEGLTEITHFKEQLNILSFLKFKNEHQRLVNLEQLALLFDSDLILKKGYAMVRKENEIVTLTTKLNKGDAIEIEFIDRILTAKIEKEPQWKNLPTKAHQQN